MVIVVTFQVECQSLYTAFWYRTDKTCNWDNYTSCYFLQSSLNGHKMLWPSLVYLCPPFSNNKCKNNFATIKYVGSAAVACHHPLLCCILCTFSPSSFNLYEFLHLFHCFFWNYENAHKVVCEDTDLLIKDQGKELFHVKFNQSMLCANFVVGCLNWL